MKVYLDNAATTRVLKPVQERMLAIMDETYGNPSAMHLMGVEAENCIKQAREQIASTLKVDESSILFTSGGTEANNLAIIGTAEANKRAGNHVITTAIEHPSVSMPFGYLEEQGFSVTYLPTDRNGRISLSELEESITPDTILVSVMYVNNEMGALEPVEEIARIVHKKNAATVFHVDAIQAYGKIPVYPKKQGIDLLSVSGHKFHGPKGVGFLYMNPRIKVKPLMLGGGQQQARRSGTENVPGAVGMALAAELIGKEQQAHLAKYEALRSRLAEGLLTIEGTTVNGDQGVPYIISVSFSGVRSEVLLHALEERGIYVSAGSACSTHKRAKSPTLLAIGVDKTLLESTLRFSFGIYNTEEEIDYTVQVLREILPFLRRYSRK